MNKPLRVLLLENINPIARDLFLKSGFQVDLQKNSLSENELIKALKNADILGIRSKTQLTKKVLEESRHLLTAGCFCVGTNQVDLEAARVLGIPIFNAPYSNTRSVAEMSISNIIALSRKIGTRNIEIHQGKWNKESEGCFEVRGKTLGIVGYGNVGSQVSMLAEAIGMRVMFYDIVDKLPLGNAKPQPSLQELLANSDYVTLHVPETAMTKNMIGTEEIKTMNRGSYLLNSSRGTVVDIEALVSALKEKHLAGCAIDVYPTEPEAKVSEFKTPLAGCENTILTPHIGGATEEAQASIGKEVSSTLIRFITLGSTNLAVNFPRTEMPKSSGSYRIMNIHKNLPGVLKDINRIVSEYNGNIVGQSLATDAEIGYVLMDLEDELPLEAIQKINSAPNMLRTRPLK